MGVGGVTTGWDGVAAVVFLTAGLAATVFFTVGVFLTFLVAGLAGLTFFTVFVDCLVTFDVALGDAVGDTLGVALGGDAIGAGVDGSALGIVAASCKAAAFALIPNDATIVSNAEADRPNVAIRDARAGCGLRLNIVNPNPHRYLRADQVHGFDLVDDHCLHCLENHFRQNYRCLVNHLLENHLEIRTVLDQSRLRDRG